MEFCIFVPLSIHYAVHINICLLTPQLLKLSVKSSTRRVTARHSSIVDSKLWTTTSLHDLTHASASSNCKNDRTRLLLLLLLHMNHSTYIILTSKIVYFMRQYLNKIKQIQISTMWLARGTNKTNFKIREKPCNSAKVKEVTTCAFWDKNPCDSSAHG